MKRNRPKQHVRKLKSGKKILVNKGISKKTKRKRYSEKQYKYVSGIIKNLRNENQKLASRFDRIRDQQDDPITIRRKILNRQKLISFKRQVADNNEKIDRLNRVYFPENPR